jgi:type IV pilus assembly protein PilX
MIHFTHKPKRLRPAQRRQKGIVLIITMVMLVIISLAAINAMRSSTTNEVVANNSRAQALAMQASEAGLRYCEDNVISQMKSLVAGTTPTVVVTIDPAPVPASDPYRWTDVPSNWDSTTATAVLVPLSVINATVTGSATALYRRQPECMAQYIDSGDNTKAVITARGFGPEVPAVTSGAARTPIGSEVWLQSSIQVSNTTTSPITP